MPLGPDRAKPLNPEAAGAGGGPGLHQRRPAADHQHPGGARAEESATVDVTQTQCDSFISFLFFSFAEPLT